MLLDTVTNTKKVGRLRILSRQAGNRESTPDQDDIKPIYDSDVDDTHEHSHAYPDTFKDASIPAAPKNHDHDDKNDALDALQDKDKHVDDFLSSLVIASIQKDQIIEQELKQHVKESIAQGTMAKPHYGLDRWASDSDSDGGDHRRTTIPTYKSMNGHSRDNGIVEFDTSGNLYPDILDKKARKKKSRPMNADAVPVKPGELTHVHRGDPKIVLPTTNNNTITTARTTINSKNFTCLGVQDALCTHLQSLGFITPTHVQHESIPVLLQGRDTLVNAPTGSGKTLSYIIPILQDLASMQPRVHRSDGTLALVVLPTRELTQQVADVATLVARRYAWIVPGSIHGGENRAKEKARLRKGISLLIATPGRLLDHLESTKSFLIQSLRWLVLDEADRLLDLGFEKKIQQILDILLERVHRSAITRDRHGDDAMEDDDNEEMDLSLHENTKKDKARSPSPLAVRKLAEGKHKSWQTVLLSATLHTGLDRLLNLSLKDPHPVGFALHVEDDGSLHAVHDRHNTTQPQEMIDGSRAAAVCNTASLYTIPGQLKQRFLRVPCKLRLIALAALLKSLSMPSEASKVVVFFSSCDSVEFHHAALETAWPRAFSGAPLLLSSCKVEGSPSSLLVKLHGNMTQNERTASLIRFTKATSGALLCTDVAARGLDFPAVTSIVQFDAPGTAEEYVHRVGRTARLGQCGEAFLFVQPHEEIGYLDYLQQQGIVLTERRIVTALDRAFPSSWNANKKGSGVLGGSDRLAKGYGDDRGVEHHQGAFIAQRWLMDEIENDVSLLKKAEDGFRSFVRAYSTHSSNLKHVFSMRLLHLGHVAHSFGLKGSPGVGSNGSASSRKKKDFGGKKRSFDQHHGGGGAGKRKKTAFGGSGYVLE